MKLSHVLMDSSVYDPRREWTGRSEFLAGASSFEAAAGYEIEIRDGVLLVTHSNRTAVFGLDKMHCGLRERELPMRHVERPSLRAPEAPMKNQQQRGR